MDEKHDAMTREDYSAANRTHWNQTGPVHARARLDFLLSNFRQPGFSYLDDQCTRILQTIGIAGKAVAQLCCNNGRELLSVKNLGAGRCVGFDLSDAFIEQAEALRRAGDIECEFVRADVYDIPAAYDRQFDLVLVTIGSIKLLPDLPQFFRVVARLLRPAGHVFLYEMHPMLDMFERDERHDPPRLAHSYFRTEPFVKREGFDYWTMTTFEAAPMYWFHHQVSDVISACLRHGLCLELFEEYDHDVSSTYAHFDDLRVKPPLSYALVARAGEP